MLGTETISCSYKDGMVTCFYENIFKLTEEQKEELRVAISQMTKEEHRNRPYKMKISENQRSEIIKQHKVILKALKKVYSVDTDEQLAKNLYDDELIVFSEHALSRLSERFGVITDSPFSELYKRFDMDPSQPSELALEAAEVFVRATTVESKIEWSTSEFCRANYYLDGDKTVLSVENQYLPGANTDEYFFVITVMKKDLQ